MCFKTVAKSVVVLDDPVVNENNFPERARMRVGIFCGGWSVSCPAGVGDAAVGRLEVSSGGVLLDELRELGNFAALFSDLKS